MKALILFTAITLVSCSKKQDKQLVIHRSNTLMNTQLDVSVDGKNYHFENNGWDTIIVANKAKITYTFSCQKTALNADDEGSVEFDHETSGTIHTAFCPSDNGTVTGEFKYK